MTVVISMKQNPASDPCMTDACKQMMAHASRDYPEEACGLLVQMDEGAVWAVQCRNISQSPKASYEIHPDDLRLVYEEAGWRVIGVYHSHPSGSPEPSKTDLKFLDPSLRYFIVTREGVHEFEMEAS